MKSTNPALLILETQQTVAELDLKIAELQKQLDAVPQQEAALSEDRSKSPAEIRAGLAKLRDQRTDLRLTQKRLEEDRCSALAKFDKILAPQVRDLIAKYFLDVYTNLKTKAIDALAPFFNGDRGAAEHVLGNLPAISVAQTHAGFSHERVKGETVELRLKNFVATIKEIGLHEPR